MSRINFSRLRSLTVREIASALRRDGFVEDPGGGSHRHFLHPDGRKVTVAFHGSGQTFHIRTLRSIIQRQARWTMDDLRRLGLI